MEGSCFRIRVFSDSLIRAHEQSLRSTTVVAAPRSQIRLSQKMYLNTCGAILNPFYLQMIVLMRKLCPIPPYQSRRKQGNMKEKSAGCMYAILLKKKKPQVKLETDTGSSGSDLEIVYIKPASKKARRESAQIKKEASGSQPSSRGLFCKQGHDMILTAPPAKVIRSAREYDVVNVTCDSCGVLAAGSHTYRCAACDWDICLACARKTK